MSVAIAGGDALGGSVSIRDLARVNHLNVAQLPVKTLLITGFPDFRNSGNLLAMNAYQFSNRFRLDCGDAYPL